MLDGVDAFFVGVAVSGFLFVADADEWRLEDVDVSRRYEFG